MTFMSIPLLSLTDCDREKRLDQQEAVCARYLERKGFIDGNEYGRFVRLVVQVAMTAFLAEVRHLAKH